eukprot:g81255.t1
MYMVNGTSKDCNGKNIVTFRGFLYDQREYSFCKLYDRLLPAILHPEALKACQISLTDGDTQMHAGFEYAKARSKFSKHSKRRGCQFHLLNKQLEKTELLGPAVEPSVYDNILETLHTIGHSCETQLEAETTMKCVRIYARKTIHSTGRYEALDNYLTSLEAKFDALAYFSASTLMTLGDGTTISTDSEHADTNPEEDADLKEIDRLIYPYHLKLLPTQKSQWKKYLVEFLSQTFRDDSQIFVYKVTRLQDIQTEDRKSTGRHSVATNGPGICGADPDHITTALSSLRKASECVDAWLRGKLDIIPLSIPLWSKYVTAQEYEDVNADFDADHSDATQDRETCHYDFSNSSASTSSLKSNFSHYKAFCDERIKEQAGKASRARNQEELQWAIALAAQAHDWLDQELERKFSDSTATESSNQSSERDGNVSRKGGPSKRFVPRGEQNKPPASQKSRSNQRQTTTKRKQSSPGEEEKCEQNLLAGSEFDDVQDTPAEPPAPANKKRKTSRRAKGPQQSNVLEDARVLRMVSAFSLQQNAIRQRNQEPGRLVSAALPGKSATDAPDCGAFFWDGSPAYKLKSFAGCSPFLVPQYFTADELDRLLSSHARKMAQRWKEADKFLWCGTAEDPDSFNVSLLSPRPMFTASVPYACSNNSTAREFFEQGLTQNYGFDDNEAACSFKQAMTLDPTCGLAHLAYVLVISPNVNFGSLASVPIYSSILEALHAANTTLDSSKGYGATILKYMLEALSSRHVPKHLTLKQAIADASNAFVHGYHPKAYLDKMLALYQMFPEDEWVAMATAAALMSHPAWQWWARGSEYPAAPSNLRKGWLRDTSSQPSILNVSDGILPNAALANAILLEVLKRNPLNVGANHLYIHNVEMSPQPRWAVGSAERLHVFDSTGHVTHMSAHVYTRTGHYRDSIEANKRANQRDFRWALARAGGMFLSPFYKYQLHDVAFQLEAAMHMYHWGELVAPLSLTNRLTAFLTRADGPGSEYAGNWLYQYLFPLRFGRFREVLRDLDKSPANAQGEIEYRPGEKLVSVTVQQARLFAESVAAARTGDVARAGRALGELLRLVAARAQLTSCTELRSTCIQAACDKLVGQASDTERTRDVDDIGTPTIDNGDARRCLYLLVPWADLLIANASLAEAEQTLLRALETQRSMVYDEPSGFFYPIAATLGRLYLLMGKLGRAASTFREGLFTHPRSFQLVMGLYEAFSRRGNGQEVTILSLVRENGNTHLILGIPDYDSRIL